MGSRECSLKAFLLDCSTAHHTLVPSLRVWTDITSKASTFWRTPSDDVTRVGFAKTTKPGRPASFPFLQRPLGVDCTDLQSSLLQHYLLDMPESSASTATRSSRSLKKVVSVSYFNATGLQYVCSDPSFLSVVLSVSTYSGNSYKLKHPEGKPVGTVEFTVCSSFSIFFLRLRLLTSPHAALAPLPDPPVSKRLARPTRSTAPLPSSQETSFSTSVPRATSSAKRELKAAPIRKPSLSSFGTVTDDEVSSSAPSSPCGDAKTKVQKMDGDGRAKTTMAGSSSSNQLTRDDIDFEHERAMLELEEEEVALIERKLAVKKRKLMLAEEQRKRQRGD